MVTAMKRCILLQLDQIGCVGVFYYLKEASAEIEVDSNPFSTVVSQCLYFFISAE